MPVKKRVTKTETTTNEVPEEAQVSPEEEVSAGRNYRRWSVFVIFALIIVILVAGGTYIYQAFLSSEAISLRETKRIEKETRTLLEEVGELMVLPGGEVPLIYEVNDPNILTSQQPFFAGAETGDKLIIYPTAVKAILYSTARHKIINVGPITFDSTNSNLAPAQ